MSVWRPLQGRYKKRIVIPAKAGIYRQHEAWIDPLRCCERLGLRRNDDAGKWVIKHGYMETTIALIISRYRFEL